MNHTVKYWETKEDFDKGEAKILDDNFEKDFAMEFARLLLLKQSYAVEVFETESGNTIYHSND
jgi:hypothetical protein